MYQARRYDNAGAKLLEDQQHDLSLGRQVCRQQDRSKHSYGARYEYDEEQADPKRDVVVSVDSLAADFSTMR